MSRSRMVAVCSIALIVATACASNASDERAKQDNAHAREADQTPSDEVGFEIEAGSQAELPHAPDPPPAAEGWRWESSLGIELAVPADWSVNDVGCLQTDAPTIVRGTGGGLDCFTPEALTKEIVLIGRVRTVEDILPPQ